jgi:hypothetical protein
VSSGWSASSLSSSWGNRSQGTLIQQHLLYT